MIEDKISPKSNDQYLIHDENPVLERMIHSIAREKDQANIDNSSPIGRCNLETNFNSKSPFSSTNNNIFGRDEEITQIINSFERLVSYPNDDEQRKKPELVLVHGKSGTGKSSLVQAFLKRLHDVKQKVFFVEGKFDQLKTNSPYAALINASNDLAKQVLQDDNAKDIMARIRSQFGPDVSILGNTIPALSAMSDIKSTGTPKDVDGQAFARFKLLIRSFFRSVATANKPVILFLDDLQWADTGTLQVLQSLLSDPMSRHIMFFFAFRDDEINQQNLDQLIYPQQSFVTNNPNQITKEQMQKETSSLQITDINLSNLDSTSLNKMISAILKMNEKQTQNLTQIIHNKTDGNPFHVINFMDMLHSTGMILFQNQRQEQQQDERQQKWNWDWDWDCNYILQQTDVSDNLADILEAKILRLPEKIRSILQLASFIGYDFSIDVLTTIVHQEQDMIEGEYSFESFDRNIIHRWIIQALSVASKEGLVEMTSDSETGTYKFSHDRIQQCLYKDLIPDDVERRLLHQRIGKLLWQTIKTRNASDIDDWILFLATDNLNRGPRFVDDDMDRCEMIELNLRAARLARDKVAFHVSVEYLRCGKKLIKDDEFIESNYDLCISYLNAAADGERIVGCFDRCNELLNMIFKHSRSLEDRFPAYMTEIKTIATYKELDDAMELAFARLRLVGVKFAKNITLRSVLSELIRTKLLIGRRKPEDLMRLPMMTNKRKLFAMELLCAVYGAAFFGGESKKYTFVVVLLRMTYLTVRFGLSDLYAPQAFVGYGVLHSVLGKFDTATLYGNLGMSLLDKLDSEKTQGKTKIMYLSFIHPWKHGLEEMLDGMMCAHQEAMRVGEVQYAYWGVGGWLLVAMNTMTIPLPNLMTQTKAFCAEMKECGMRAHVLMTTPLLQMISNMVGDRQNRNPAILSGEAMNLNEFIREMRESKLVFMERIVATYEAYMAYYFRDWELLKAKVEILLASKLDVKGYFTAPLALTSVGWYCYRLYQHTGIKKYKRVARINYSKVKNLAKKNTGSVLALVLHKQMAAGKALYLKKQSPTQAESLFTDALRDMENNNFSYLSAHVSESLAESFLETGDLEKGRMYLQKSIDISRKWGSYVKVRRLQRQISELSSPVLERTLSTEALEDI